jgi:flavin-dependent dehydrogenase
MTIQHHKVIIVGAGPAGLATALFLAQQAPELARDTLILEAKQHPRPKLCGGGVTFHGADQLKRLGIHLDIPVFVIHRLLFQLGMHTFRVNHNDAMHIYDRAVFDAALADEATRRGVQIRTNEPLIDLRHTEDGVELTTANARYHAKVVVGADGANSTVRRKLRIFSTVGVARLLRIMTPIPTQTPAWTEHTAVFDFSCVLRGIQGYMWDFPCFVDGSAYMNRGILDSRIVPRLSSERSRGTLKQAFDAGLRERAVDPQAVVLEGHPVRWFNAQAEFARPHIVLAGDAAGVDPLFAEGISYAMEYGAVVVEALKDAFARSDFSFQSYRARLLDHQLGHLLLRRVMAARHFYTHRFPGFWALFWRLAAVAPQNIQNRFASALALLPP